MDDIKAELFHSAAGREWRNIGVEQHHGIALPLFGLRSQNSCGIGEFPDLLPLIPWCSEMGFDTIQLLPINDTGLETSPYSALSAFALNPLHLGLTQLPYLDQLPEASAFIKKMQALNETQRIDYPALHKVRESFLIYYAKNVGPQICSSLKYQLFLSRNPWVQSYALFKAIQRDQAGESWTKWPEELAKGYDPQLMQRYKEAIGFHSLIQYLCFQQFQQVKRAAEAAHLFLKGDIPILINRESADVWANRTLFMLDYQAGAPPDMYAKEGQKWGFPLYNWAEMEKSHYDWWKNRLETASRLYHLYRLDHIVGFFRIWAVALDKPATEGAYIPSDPALWIAHGEGILRAMLQSCPMLPIGEDLGTVPPEVRICLKKLGICGTKVLRWERNWEGDCQFIPYNQYPPASMSTVSTHDSPTLKLWWQGSPEEAKLFAQFKHWNYTPDFAVEQQREILRDSHHTSSLFHINLLNEYLALVPGMTWDNPEDERINWPGTVSDKNWTYRFRPHVEQIVASDPLRSEMERLIPHLNHSIKSSIT